PDSCAICFSVPGLGSTRICSVYPPVSVAVTIPFGVPTSTVEIGMCAARARRAAVARPLPLRETRRECDRVADRGALARCERLERIVGQRPVGRRRQRDE